MHRGYVKLWRKAKESGVYKDGLWRVFCHCLFSARPKPYKVIIRGKERTLPAGTFTTGRYLFGRELGLKPTTAWKRLKSLERCHKAVTLESVISFTIVTVLNWAYYDSYKPGMVPQESDSIGDTSGGTTSGTTGDTSTTPSALSAPSAKKFPPWFEKLWKIYPGRDKTPTFRACEKLVAKGIVHEYLRAAAIHYRDDPQRKADYTKNGATFYGPKGHWEDYVNEPPAPPRDVEQERKEEAYQRFLKMKSEVPDG